MHKKNIEERVENLVLEIISETDLEFVDVEYVREKDWYLRIFLDKKSGLLLDDCQMISEKIANVIDKEDFIKDRYYLEVSSPGLDRKLKKDRDLLKHKGDMIDLQLKKEKKIIVGILGEFTDEYIEVIVSEKNERFLRDDISFIRLHLDF